MNVENAIVYPLISLSQIEGTQRAAKTLHDVWACFWNRISDVDHTVDVCAVTSMGLYENIHYETRHKKRQKCAKFYREYVRTIYKRAVADNLVLPHAYDWRDLDLLTHRPQAINSVIQAVGKLNNYIQASVAFRAAVEELCFESGREFTKENINFFLEELAAFYLFGERILSLPRNDRCLRRDDSGAIFLTYPGPTSSAEIMAWNFLHGPKEYKKNKTFNVNISDSHNPVFLDMGDVVGFYAKGEKVARKAF
jgi:hypothetical protein